MTWADTTFRTSACDAKIFRLARPLRLSSEEECKFVISHSALYRESGFVRGTGFSFSTGMTKEDLCALGFSFYTTSQGGLRHIVKRTRTGSEKNLRIHCDNFYSDQHLTPEWQFESAVAEIEAIIDNLRGVRAETLSNKHPLLNPYGIKSIQLGG